MQICRFAITLILVTLAIAAGTNASQRPELTRDQLNEKSVSLTLENAGINEVLRLLAAQNQINLSLSGEIEGTLTLTLQDVGLATAFDIIAAEADADWYIAGNVVVVKPMDRLDPGQLETRLFRLDYLPATEAERLFEPLLPEGSFIEVLSGSGSGEGEKWDEIVEVVSSPAVLQRIESMLVELDRARPLVGIEVKIIETDVRDETRLGLDFPDQLSVKTGDLPEELGVTGALTHDLNNPNWTWGKMTVDEVSVVLDLLIKNGRSKLVSNPRITTLSNQEAEIEVTTTIPVQTLNRFSEAGVVQDIVSFQDLDVSISLSVTPRVNRDSSIVLAVSSSVEEITGYTGPADNQRPITARRSITSAVTVKNGESLGLGGLVKEVEHSTIQKLPLLGHIPLLGKIFQHESTNVEKTDLLILITPKIISMP
jgi:type IV pilus assembly protein PilQ